jgi:hypothetical protein
VDTSVENGITKDCNFHLAIFCRGRYKSISYDIHCHIIRYRSKIKSSLDGFPVLLELSPDHILHQRICLGSTGIIALWSGLYRLRLYILSPMQCMTTNHYYKIIIIITTLASFVISPLHNITGQCIG